LEKHGDNSNMRKILLVLTSLGAVVVSSEYGDEPSDSVKGREFLH
jgi:hypothetical protein